MRLSQISQGTKLFLVVVGTTIGFFIIHLLLKTKVKGRLSFLINKTWDGKPIQHEQISMALVRKDSVVEIEVEAPFFNDPPAPDGEAGKPFQQLWDFEVVEAFFLNGKDEYLEVELCPHGQHLVLMLKERRNVVRDKLSLTFTSEIKNNHWTGRARIPLDYFPPGVTKFNAYAIHGSGSDRVYEALYKVPGDKPDFHRLEYFESLDFQKLVPENSEYSSPYWSR